MKKVKMSNKSGNIKKYNDIKLFDAIAAVRNGSAIRKASRQFGVPRTTLCRKLKTNARTLLKPGPKGLLPKDVEDKLAQWIVEGSKEGDFKTHFQINDHACKLAVENDIHAFNKHGPSKKWLYNFFRRHPELLEQRAKKPLKAAVCSDTEEDWSIVKDSAHTITHESFLDNYDENQLDQNLENDDVTIEQETKHQIPYDLLVNQHQDPLSNTVDSSQGSSTISNESPYTAGLRILGPELVKEFESPHFLEQLEYKRKLYEMYVMLKTKEEDKLQSLKVPVEKTADRESRMILKRPFSSVSGGYLHIKQEKQKEE